MIQSKIEALANHKIHNRLRLRSVVYSRLSFLFALLTLAFFRPSGDQEAGRRSTFALHLHHWESKLAPMKFRMPTSDNLVPIRLNIEVDGQHHLKDAFTWNPNDPDSEVVSFAKRTVKDLKLPPAFITQIAQSIQTQLAEFRSLEGQDMHVREKIVPLKLDLRVNNTLIRDQFLWDLGNFENDPEEFTRTLCTDMEIADPEVGPSIAVSIREQLYEMAIQNVASAREYRIGKKGRRGFDQIKAGNNGLDLMKFFGSKGTAIRKRKEWDLYDPIVDILSNEEVTVLNAREERTARLKRKADDNE